MEMVKSCSQDEKAIMTSHCGMNKGY